MAQKMPNCANLQGSWKNQLGSNLNIQQVEPKTGALKGYYINYSSPSTKFPMVGWNNTKPKGIPVLTFAVQWGETAGSLTAWTGYCENGSNGPTLTTLWHLTRSISAYKWDHIITNSDVFTPM
jgi:hypothetical protein